MIVNSFEIESHIHYHHRGRCEIIDSNPLDLRDELANVRDHRINRENRSVMIATLSLLY